MKTEITLENKRRFFLHYYGETRIYWPKSNYYSDNFEWLSDSLLSQDPRLLLTPLSDITDGDALEVGYRIIPREQRNFKYDAFCKEDGCAWAKRQGMKPTMGPNECASAIDFLRSRGYLVSWNGLSPEEIIKAGWVELKTKKG